MYQEDPPEWPDGIALNSMSHPREPWWKRLFFFWRWRSRLNEKYLVTMDWDGPDRSG
jgi:hypothetical protein